MNTENQDLLRIASENIEQVISNVRVYDSTCNEIYSDSNERIFKLKHAKFLIDDVMFRV